MKNSLLTNFLFSFLLFLFIVSCNDHKNNETFGTSILDTMSNEKIGHSTRAFVEEKEETMVSFTVIYNGDLTKMTTDENSAFKKLIENYNLEIQKPFEIDEENKGIVLVPQAPLAAPIKVGKEISLVDEVLMVEVDNVTKEKDEKDPS
ncbi:hypothetical protein [Aureispira sp. CCB-E]|uniref:hypothetical protein n=1 Tax=Aureispira sp. CCB-E TaxID=3051121 RepID=UPI0028685D58|nr:hypothetical protein [Aureispira sp. CCB-E]WMX13053.1 hypothetical protein QP953_19625 [Aureispira sp. CCB-E]